MAFPLEYSYIVWYIAFVLKEPSQSNWITLLFMLLYIKTYIWYL